MALGCVVLPAAWLVHRIYFDRSNLPSLDGFYEFQPPTTGEVRDAQGQVLIELAREYRRVVTYDEVPPVLRQAILAAEDKNFFSHSGVDYGALPRVVGQGGVALARGSGGTATRAPADGFPRAARRSPSSSCAATSCAT